MGRIRRPRRIPPAASFSDSEPEEISMDSSDRDPDEISMDHVDDLDDIRIPMDHHDDDPPIPKTREELQAYVDSLKNVEKEVNEGQKLGKGIQAFFMVTIALKSLYTVWTLAHASSFSGLDSSDYIFMFFVMVFMWLSTLVNWTIVSLFKKNKNQQLLNLSKSGVIDCDKKLQPLLLAKIVIIFLTLFFLLRGIDSATAWTPFEFILPLYLYVFTYGGFTFLLALAWLQYKIRTSQLGSQSQSTTSGDSDSSESNEGATIMTNNV